MTLVIVILVLLLTLAFFYLKCSIMQSFMTLWSAILATIVAFSYYEWVANLLISREHGLNWALCGSFVILFIFVFAILRLLSDLLVAAPVELGNIVKLPVSVICGLLTGFIFSGNLLIVLGLLPMHGKVFYSRYAPDAPVQINSPRTAALNADGFVTGLYRLISSGSMRSDKSFGVFHADYLSQIHLNKLKTKEDILSVCSKDALTVPTEKTKNPVRRKNVGEKELVIVRVGVHAKKIASGGAGTKLSFFPAQIRLIVKETNDRNEDTDALYPYGLWNGVKVVKKKPEDTIEPDSKKFVNNIYWMDVAFECPENKKPILLQFKQNAVVELPEAVNSTPEIEQALDSKEETSS